jgi:hypothetical protein
LPNFQASGFAQFSGPSGFAQFSGSLGSGLGYYLVKSSSPTHLYLNPFWGLFIAFISQRQNAQTMQHEFYASALFCFP